MVFGKFPPPRYDRLATTEQAGALSAADKSKLDGLSGKMSFIGESSSEVNVTEAAATSSWRTAWGDTLTTPIQVTITSSGPTDRFLLVMFLRMICSATPGVAYLGYSVGTTLVNQVQSGDNAGSTDHGLLGVRSITGLAAGSYVVQLRFYTANAVTAQLLAGRYLQIFQVG